jgi:undecaprenyl-diphosphatase
MQKTMNVIKSIIRDPIFIIFSISTVLFVWSAVVASSGTMTAWEMSLFGKINQMTDILKWPAIIGTQFGDIAIIAALLLGFVVFNKKRAAVFVFVASGAVTVITQLAKMAVDRQRPFELVEPVLARVQEHGLGYPSRHTALAAALSILMVYLFGRKWLWVPFVWVLGVGFTRIYLGAHAPLDIVGGFALGAMIACALIVCEKLWKKLKVKA